MTASLDTHDDALRADLRRVKDLRRGLRRPTLEIKQGANDGSIF